MEGSEDANEQGHSAHSKPKTNIFREYYIQNDIFSSIEGILKIISAIVCVVTSVLFLGWSSCLGAGAGAGLGAAALAGGLAITLLVAGVAARLPLYAPQAWLYTDLIVSTVLGVLLLLSGVLSMTCEASAAAAAAALDYLRPTISILNAGLMIASAVITYVSVMRRWDAVRGPVIEPHRPRPCELEV